jgi:hypothetical protein
MDDNDAPEKSMNNAEAAKSRRRNLWRENVRLAKQVWGANLCTRPLEKLTTDFRLSVKNGDLQVIDRQWYVTHAGLLGFARRKRCSGIHVEIVDALCNFSTDRFAFKAIVYPTKQSLGFVGYGDADPSNVSPLVRGAEMRVAETRAVNRALRKAYGIGICSFEEIGKTSNPWDELSSHRTNGNGNGRVPKVRDRLCQIIRRYQLDPELVKAYAVDFCGAKTLKDASREHIENFVRELGHWAEKDRNALLCQLNSYARPKPEVVA